MAQKSRNKEFWLIPKRANLHQSVALIKGIDDLDYNGKTWNSSKQDRLGSYLGKKGATNNGKNITPQALRTLLASIPQYFGFAFINTETTPNTLVLTPAAYSLIKELDIFLDKYKYPNLKLAEKEKGVINYSETYLKQFLKLQITNPVIIKDCENISIFPLLFTLRILKRTRYLTYEEIAYFIFRSRFQSELDLTILEIKNFRKLDFTSQLELIEAFKKTHLGNISLVQAPTVSYYQKLCSYTGLIKKSTKELSSKNNNQFRKVNSIIINEEKEELIDEIIEKHNYLPYDFKNNLKLWLEYIGNTDVLSTPKDVEIKNTSNFEQLIIILENNSIIGGDLISCNSSLFFPAIEGYNYKIVIYDKKNGSELNHYYYEFSQKNIIEINDIEKTNVNNLDKTNLEQEIVEHISSKNFSSQYLQYINIISKLINKNLEGNKNLRGSRLEFLFYQYCLYLEKTNIVDEVIWNGKIGEYGIPSPAPGGPNGDPDILIFIGDTLVVLELTTIKSKSQQWSAEGASVPDHIRLIEIRYPKNKIFALYLAPIIHEERVTNAMLSRLKDYKSKLKCLEIEEFLKILKKFRNKYDFINFLNKN